MRYVKAPPIVFRFLPELLFVAEFVFGFENPSVRNGLTPRYVAILIISIDV